jgi:hypothetical protein
MAKSWIFEASFPDARRQRLEAVSDFDEVIELLATSIQSISVKHDPGRDPGMEDCKRPVLTLIAPGAFDAFFNAAAGYRGQFWQDPDLGQAANGRIIRRLTPSLLGAIEAANLPELRAINPKTSLRAVSAKIWVHEDDFPLDSPTRDLAVEPWATRAKQGIGLAQRGICAPAEARLQILGAFLDTDGHERVHRDKIPRRFDLHEYGFS